MHTQALFSRQYRYEAEKKITRKVSLLSFKTVNFAQNSKKSVFKNRKSLLPVAGLRSKILTSELLNYEKSVYFRVYDISYIHSYHGITSQFTLGF